MNFRIIKKTLSLDVDGELKQINASLNSIHNLIDSLYVEIKTCRRGDIYSFSPTKKLRAEDKADKILDYLKLEYQENCIEKLPKIIKIRREKKK